MRVFACRAPEGGAPRIVGHRGGRGEGWPAENTLGAFARAHAEGADAIELDVRTCRGGEVVVFHDADLTRMTGGRDRRAIAATAMGELARVALGPGGERAPTLAEVLGWAAGRLAVNVELKRDVPDRWALARATAAVIARHARVEVLVSSFDPLLLAAMATLAPRVPRAWLGHAGQARWERAWAPVALRAPIAALHLEETMASAGLVHTAHQRGRAVGAWTVNDGAEARALARVRVDWLITDAPGAVRAALATPSP